MSYAELVADVDGNISPLEAKLNRADNLMLAFVRKNYLITPRLDTKPIGAQIGRLQHHLKSLGNLTIPVDLEVKVNGAKIDLAKRGLADLDKHGRALEKVMAEIDRRGGKAMLPFINSIADVETKLKHAQQQLNQLKASSGMVKLGSYQAAKLQTGEEARRIKEVHKEIDRVLGKTSIWQRATQNLNKTLAETGNTIVRWGLGYVVVSQLIEGVKALTFATIGYNDVLDKAGLTFTAQMAGNREQSRAFIGDMEELAAKTPFELVNTLPIAQKLKDAGRSFKTLREDITSIGDFVARSGEGTDFIDRITYALNQISTAGKVAGTEIRQLTEARVPAVKILADAWGVNTSKMQEWVRQGIVPADKAVDALIKGMGRIGEGFMEKQNRTLMGALSSMKDGFNRLVGTGLRPLYDELTRVANKMATFMNSAEGDKAAAKWSVRIRDLIIQLKAAYEVVDDLKGGIIGLGVALAGVKVGSSLVGLFKLLQTLKTFGATASAGAGLTPVLGSLATFASNPYVLAVLAGTVLIGGIAMWGKWRSELEKTRKTTEAIERGTKASTKAISDMQKVLGSNMAANNLVNNLEKAVETAHGDVGKLKKALDDLSKAEYKVKKLGLDVGATNVFMESVRELKRAVQRELSDINASVNLSGDGASNARGTNTSERLNNIAAIRKEGEKYGVNVPIPPIFMGGNIDQFKKDVTDFNAQLDAAVKKIREIRGDDVRAEIRERLSKYSDAPEFKVPRLLQGKGAQNLAYLKKEYAKFEELIKKQGDFKGADKSALANLKNAINQLDNANGKLVDTVYSESDLLQAKSKNAAKELEKQASMYDKIAAASEASARRQIAAIESVAGQVRDLFGASQSELLKYGIANSPSSQYIAQLEKILNLRGKANTALSEWNNALSLRDQAQSTRDNAASLSDTAPAPSDLGMKIANAAVRMQAQAHKFKDQCDKLADITVRGVTKVYDAFMGPGKGRASAYETMMGFKNAGVGFAANGSYAPGDIVYSGKKFGKGSGHVMIVGPDGKFYDQYGANKTPYTTPEWVVRPGGNQSSSQSTTNSPRKPLGGKKGVAAALFGDESPLAGINLSLSPFAKLPKEWGEPIKETSENTTRFALQVKLLDENFLNLLRSTGKFKEALLLLKKAANADDFKLNFERIQKAAHSAFLGRVEDLNKRMRMRGKENDPFAVLQDSRRKGGDLYGASDLDIQILKNKTLRDTLDGLTLSIRDGNKALTDKNRVLEAGRKFITQSGVDEYNYAKAIEKRGKEIEYWSRAEVVSLHREGEAKRQAIEVLKKEIAALEKQAAIAVKKMDSKKGDKIATSLLGKTAMLNRLRHERNTITGDLNRNSNTFLSGWETDYDLGKATERSLAISRTRGELDLQKDVLGEIVKLTQNWVGTENGLVDAIAKKETVLRKIKEFEDAGYGAQSTSLANEVAYRENINRGLERTKTLFDELRSSAKETGIQIQNALDARALISAYEGNDGVRDVMTRLKELEQAKFRKIAELPIPGYLSGTGADSSELGQKIEENFQKERKSLLLSFENQRIQTALQSAFQAEFDIKTRKLVLERGITEEKRLQAQFDLEDAALKKAGLTLTQEELDARTRLLAAARQSADLDKDEWRKGLADDLSLSRRFGNDRLDRQFELMGKKQGWSEETIAELLPVDRMYRKVEKLFEGLNSLMDGWQSDWSTMWQDIGQTADFSLSKLLNGLTDKLVSWGAQVLADATWQQVMNILGSVIPMGKVAGPTKGVGPVANGGNYADMIAKNPPKVSVSTSQIAMELTRGAAMSSSVAAARSGGGNTAMNFYGDVVLPNVRKESDMPNAINKTAGAIPQSRRSNSKTAQGVVSNGV
jgi:tape measure domain-containing protein